MRRQPKRSQIFPLLVESHGFLKIPGDLVERATLRYHGDFDAFSDVPGFFPAPNNGLDGVLKRSHKNQRLQGDGPAANIFSQLKR